MIKRIYSSTLHIKDPAPHFPSHLYSKGHASAVHDVAVEASTFLPPFFFKVIADLSDKMDESIHV